MAIKVNNTTVIDDSRNINNVGIVTASSFNGSLTGTATTATNLADAANITTGTINSERLSGTYNISISGSAGYATTAGIATVAQGLTGTPNITVGIVTATSGNFSDIITSSGANISGVSTLGTLQVSSGIVTATSGIITYYGDGSKLSNVISGIGINSSGTIIGTGVTILNFIGIGNTFSYNQSTKTIDISIPDPTINKQSFTVGAGGTNTFTLFQSYSPNMIDVFVNGIRLAAGDFTETSSNVISLATAASQGDIVEFQAYSTRTANTNLNSTITNLTVTGILTASNSVVLGVTTSNGFNATTGNDYKINGTSVLTSTTLGSNVVDSSLTSVGTLGQLNVTGVTTSGQLNVTGVTTSSRFVSNVATGTSPISVASTTKVTNLNADLFDDQDSSYYTNASNISSGIVSTARLATSGTANNTSFLRGDQTWAVVDATKIINGTSEVNIASSNGNIAATVAGQSTFNVTGAGVSMVAGKRLDVSSFSESVQTLGSSGSPISGTNSLNIGTYSTFIAYVGTSAVTFTLTGAVSGRLSSWTLILIYTNSGSRSVSYSFGTLRYPGGSASVTLSNTQVHDILSFFTADGATNTYASVVGLGFAT